MAAARFPEFGRERTLERGEFLFRKDDPAIGLYAVEEGRFGFPASIRPAAR